MTIAIVVVLLVGFLAWRETQHDKQTQTREKEWALERAALLNRIHAPDIAVMDSIKRPELEPVPVVPLDDDDAFRKAREMRNGTD